MSDSQANTVALRLAPRINELTAWLDRLEHPALERHEYPRERFGGARVSIDPRSTAPAASYNQNRICLCGDGGGLTESGLKELVAQFVERGVPRLFVWLSPGLGIEAVREWLVAMSFARGAWTRYPTMLLTERAPVRPHAFDIRQIGGAAFAAAKGALGNAVMEGYALTLGKPGFTHYIAYDGARPIAVAALATFDEIGYLTFAGTVETDRRRGAQSALIAHRAEDARSAGCAQVVSQTLTMLEDSIANLERCGFREIYEQEVYGLSLE